MKHDMYPKLAWNGIRKNKRFYTPYILTCTGMVMMFYIVSFLTNSKVLKNMVGGEVMHGMLDLGCGVIGVFALIFLFYTNSFLIRRRKKEFGLYNILGMGKWNLARVLICESIIIAVISLAGGLTAGIVFSKFAELGMVNVLNSVTTFSLTIEIKAVYQTLTLFAVIFVLLLIHSLRQIHLSNPIELLRSENVGEKPPKANWILALTGAIILLCAYYLAVSIEDPITAMILFFVAVIMVIIATYLLFIAGSVAICKILQKKKNYYYKTNHFVSVSSMTYRMKRNGAGLASICILCTMVLVMISATVCLYVGAEDSLRNRYPRNINFDTNVSNIEDLDSEKCRKIEDLSTQVLAKYEEEPENFLDYKVAAFAGVVNGDTIEMDLADSRSYSDYWQVFIVSLDDYNRLMGQNETLEKGEVLIYTTKTSYKSDTVAIGEGEPFKIKKVVPDFADNGVDAMQIIPSMYIFVNNIEECAEPVDGTADYAGNKLLEYHWYYGFDLDCNDEMQIQIYDELTAGLNELSLSDDSGYFETLCESVAKERAGFYGLYGGLFFLGILLGVVFIFAAVLIIYYKQISEGYEDQSRFEIMQKVGMSKEKIRKSINSQILTVFFMPLITAGIHLVFAFPLIHKLLVLFSLTNLKLLILVTLSCYLIFALFYALVYKITSKAYYSIVSGAREEN